MDAVGDIGDFRCQCRGLFPLTHGDGQKLLVRVDALFPEDRSRRFPADAFDAVDGIGGDFHRRHFHADLFKDLGAVRIPQGNVVHLV